MTVRIASIPDADRLFAFVWTAYEEMPHAPKSERRVQALVRAAVERQATEFEDAGTILMPPVFGIIDGPSGIKAAVGLHVEQWWYSDAYALRGFFFHVHPDHRRSGHAQELRKFGASFANNMGMPVFFNDFGDEAKHRIFERAMPQVGRIYAAGLAA